jgi:hypothetical protein
MRDTVLKMLKSKYILILNSNPNLGKRLWIRIQKNLLNTVPGTITLYTNIQTNVCNSTGTIILYQNILAGTGNVKVSSTKSR